MRGMGFVGRVAAAGLLLLGGCPDRGCSIDHASEGGQCDRPAVPAPAHPAEAVGAGPETQATTSRTREQMHTVVTITVAAPESPEVIAALEAAFAEIDRLELLLSEWKAGSQIARVNARAGGAPVQVDAEIFEVIRAAHTISAESGGAFDVTIGALWGAWDFRWQDPKIPTATELAPRLARIDYRKVHLDPKAHTVRLAEAGMKLALGGIAKGYAIDRASQVLRARGFENHLVVAGGDLYASGRRADRPWRVGIRDPRSAAIYRVVSLENEGMATSGNYERFFMKDGVRYHHLLDPKSGQPARGYASVTVRAKTATLADGWATALFVMGPPKALARAKSLEGIDAFFFAEKSFETSGTKALLAALVAPETLEAQEAGEKLPATGRPETVTPPGE